MFHQILLVRLTEQYILYVFKVIDLTAQVAIVNILAILFGEAGTLIIARNLRNQDV